MEAGPRHTHGGGKRKNHAPATPDAMAEAHEIAHGRPCPQAGRGGLEPVFKGTRVDEHATAQPADAS
eukprot:13761858-Alexandrium_andersonii.AAC.1